jgi:hypothetical protein
MSHTRALAILTIGLVMSATHLAGQDRSRYREFQLGGNLMSVAALAGVAAADVKTIHARPALLQELQWRRGYSTTRTDPVQQIVFSFYNDQLTKLVVDYDNDRTSGMTNADMIEGISTAYGAPLKAATPKTRVVAPPSGEEPGSPIAQWGDADFSAVLYRSAYSPGFRIIVMATKLDALARTAGAQAIRLDEREAPEREIARQKKEADDARGLAEKARLANKAAFRP